VPASSCFAWWRTLPCASNNPSVTRRSLISTNASNAADNLVSRCSIEPWTFDSSDFNRAVDARACDNEALM
jgi:hypothetical protein